MKKMNLPAASLLCAAACLQCQPLNASEKADTITLNLDDVEVVANRASSKVPVAFTNVLKSDLERNNTGRDIPYLLGMTPAVVATPDAGGGMGYTSMRLRGSDNSRINVTANGIPLNDPESHRLYWVNMPDLASSLRDVQVQRGNLHQWRRSLRRQHQYDYRRPERGCLR